MMKKAAVMIWFVGDVGPASIEYEVPYHGEPAKENDRLLKDAMKKFPRFDRIEIEVA